jgi:NDP-sugar pyrophosphorylase family protein
MKAVILAGGQGTRLRPYTTVFPKPMVPVGEHPILEILLRKLGREGCTDVTLSVGYLAELIQAYFSQARESTEGLTIRYVHETQPTGTAGALRLIPDLDETFLLMNGDVLTTLPFDELVRFHRAEGAALTIAAHEKSVKIDLGVLETNPTNQVTGYVEKPTLSYRVSMGVYVLEPRVVAHVPEGRRFDFPDLVHALLAAGETVAAYPSDHFWLDIGRHEDYEAAQEAFREVKGAFGL